jgi:hypothetical protein
MPKPTHMSLGYSLFKLEGGDLLGSDGMIEMVRAFAMRPPTAFGRRGNFGTPQWAREDSH